MEDLTLAGGPIPDALVVHIRSPDARFAFSLEDLDLLAVYLELSKVAVMGSICVGRIWCVRGERSSAKKLYMCSSERRGGIKQ